MIDAKLINTRDSESGNFKSLKALVNSRERYDFAITEEFETSTGREKFEAWEDTDKSEPDWPVGQEMDAVGYFGQTLFRRGSNEPGPHSKTRHNEIYIFSGLSQEDKLRAIGHELFGHASLHEEGKNTAHNVRQERDVPFDNPQAEGKLIQAIELNSELAKKILAAVNEALKNYRESQK